MNLTWNAPDLTPFETDTSKFEFTGEYRTPKLGEWYWNEGVLHSYSNNHYSMSYDECYPIIHLVRKRWTPKPGERYWDATTALPYSVKDTNDAAMYEVAFANAKAARKAHEVLRGLDPETGEPMEAAE